MRRILLAEPDAALAAYLQRHLDAEGYAVEICGAGHEVIARISAPAVGSPPIELAIIALQLPDVHGFRVLRELRAGTPHVGVLATSECAEEAHRVRGLRTGADDFLVKPFGVDELLARVEAVLRRVPAGSSAASAAAVHRRPAGSDIVAPRAETMHFGDIVVDPVARTVTRRGADVSLAPKEFDLLLALLARRGAVASRASLLREVWGYGHAVASRTVDSHFGALRRKLEDDPRAPRHLLTAYKAGYRLRP